MGFSQNFLNFHKNTFKAFLVTSLMNKYEGYQKKDGLIFKKFEICSYDLHFQNSLFHTHLRLYSGL